MVGDPYKCSVCSHHGTQGFSVNPDVCGGKITVLCFDCFKEGNYILDKLMKDKVPPKDLGRWMMHPILCIRDEAVESYKRQAL